MADKKELLDELARCVVDMRDDLASGTAQAYVDAGFDAYEGISDGLARGMEQAGELYEEEEYFVPELLICSDAMYNGLEVLQPHLKPGSSGGHGAAIIGVVEGDTHDIGKNLVKIMLETAGFTVYDLGRDVPLGMFIDKAREVKQGILCMSTLMSTTMDGMRQVVEQLQAAGLRDSFKVMVGGGPLSQSFAEKIGADAYTTNAAEAAKKAQDLAAELA